VPGRTASIVDCGIDTFGALVGMLLPYAGWKVQGFLSKSQPAKRA